MKSRKDVEDLRVMMVELNTDPNSYPDSSSDTEQDWLAGDEVETIVTKPKIPQILTFLLTACQQIIVNAK